MGERYNEIHEIIEGGVDCLIDYDEIEAEIGEAYRSGAITGAEYDMLRDELEEAYPI
ncbi:MAG: hypothetical protein NC311_05625 [Muribaculaceae bacterium]|nr:hypothetical protein [Muribaculaceae bacterium]